MQLAEIFSAQGKPQMFEQASLKAIAIFEQIGAVHEARRVRDLLIPAKESR